MPATMTRNPVRYPRTITQNTTTGSIWLHSPRGDVVCIERCDMVGPLVCLRRLHPSQVKVWFTREQLEAVAKLYTTALADGHVRDQQVADQVPGADDEADLDDVLTDAF